MALFSAMKKGKNMSSIVSSKYILSKVRADESNIRARNI